MIYHFVNGAFETRPRENVIVVDRESLLTFIQFRSRVFDPESAAQILDSMPEDAREFLIAEFVREEALYRDAVAMGLGDDDDAIRQRLVQKAEFLAQGFVELGIEIDDERLAAYFEEHRVDYRVPAAITFTHVFFDNDRRGAEGARADAAVAAESLNAERVPFASAIEYGDRFPFHLNYVERSPDEIAAHFDTEFARQVFALTPSQDTWYGPFQSPYGQHVVLVTRIQEAHDVAFEDVRSQVLIDVREAVLHERMEEAIDRIIAAYDVEIDLSPTPVSTN